uniref:translation initiation factor IF-2 associated domain-containing protein n=1 Tax=uncultured Enterovirga sp. TaxID=2026352 RepID=UPI0035CA456E
MSDTKTPGDKTLHVSSKTLSLPKRPAEQNMVRQSFSHGRSKAVVVETVKRRMVPAAPAAREPTPVAAAKPAAPSGRPTIALSPRPAQPSADAPRPAPIVSAPAAQTPAPAPVAAPAPAAPAVPVAPRPRGIVLQTLTDQERDARNSALTDAARQDVETRRLAEDRRVAEEAGRVRAEREARDMQEREAAETRKRDEDDRRRSEDERRRRAEDEARRRLGENAPPPPSISSLRAGDAHRRPMNLDMIGRKPAGAATTPSASPAAGAATPRPGAAARPAGAGAA